MNPDINSIRDQAYTAANQTADLQGSVQPMLDQLKQNLVGIFAKDNPLIGARNDALSGYLSSNANTRASLLPSGMPQVEGRSLALSPTQQDAIVSSRNAAALAPLAGYNEILKGMYGNIGDVVNNAGNIYGSTIQSNATRAGSLMDLYKQAVAEDQFNQQMSLDRQRASQSSQPLLDPSIISLGGGAQGGQAGPGSMIDLSKYEQPIAQKKAPAQPKVNLQGTIQAAAVPGNTSIGSAKPNSGGWALQPLVDNVLNWFKGFNAPQNNFASSSQLGF